VVPWIQQNSKEIIKINNLTWLQSTYTCLKWRETAKKPLSSRAKSTKISFNCTRLALSQEQPRNWVHHRYGLYLTTNLSTLNKSGEWQPLKYPLTTNNITTHNTLCTPQKNSKKQTAHNLSWEPTNSSPINTAPIHSENTHSHWAFLVFFCNFYQQLYIKKKKISKRLKQNTFTKYI
jgi:hypothetical protein